jgi:DNA-directed RNA polymerase subunit E'/Rpb7
MNMTAFCHISPCSLVEVARHVYCLHHQGVEAVRTSETSVYFNETTRRYIPEGCNVRTRILTTAIQCKSVMKYEVRVFWDLLPCSQIDVDIDLITRQ